MQSQHTYLTPAALAREAERQRHMAKRAADCPRGFTPEGWRKHCAARALDYDRRAKRAH